MSVESLVAVVGWALIIWQAPRVDLHSRRSRYSFATILCLALAATLQAPLIAFAIDTFTHIQDLGRILQYCFAVLAASTWALVCLSLCPVVIPRRRLLAITVFTLLAAMLIWQRASVSHETIREDVYHTHDSLALSLVVHTYLLAIAIGVTIPALLYNLNRETDFSLRLRLTMLVSTQVIIAAWMMSTIGLYTLVWLDVLPRAYQSPLVPLFMVFLAITYAASLLPASAYIRLAIAIGYLRALEQLVQIHRLETCIARLLATSSKPISAYEALRVPDYVLYTLVIAVLDRRKALRVSEKPLALNMADALDEICAGSPTYQDLIKQMQHMPLQP